MKVDLNVILGYTREFKSSSNKILLVVLMEVHPAEVEVSIILEITRLGVLGLQGPDSVVFSALKLVAGSSLQLKRIRKFIEEAIKVVERFVEPGRHVESSVVGCLTRAGSILADNLYSWWVQIH